MHYILKNKRPVLCEDILKFAEWFETADRHVAKDDTRGYTVSTVFLGFDHNHRDEGDPILFETGVFQNDTMVEVHRYKSWEEAESGHKEVVHRLS